jgi:hypothetical protein
LFAVNGRGGARRASYAGGLYLCPGARREYQHCNSEQAAHKDVRLIRLHSESLLQLIDLAIRLKIWVDSPCDEPKMRLGKLRNLDAVPASQAMILHLASSPPRGE